jgi:hypothetical protein
LDNNKVFICLDGNFQHRHHERASKNYVALQNQNLFITPEDLQLANQDILEGETNQRVSQKAVSLFINFCLHSIFQSFLLIVLNNSTTQKDRCTKQHKAADDRRNASSWKGCDDTGLFGCCCRHDAVISFSNIHKSGEGRGHPTAILKQLISNIQPNIKIGVVYDIGCTLKKFFVARKLFPDCIDRMMFATAVFHSYVHDWPCQLQFNPRYNTGWGLTDGEGLERLWSYLSSLVGPLRYATRNHWLSAINHRSLFHNALGIENIGTYFTQNLELLELLCFLLTFCCIIIHLVLTLKRKAIHAVTTQNHAQSVIQPLMLQPNQHVPGECYTKAFFCDQWEKQRKFEIDLNQKDREKKEEQAQFFERGEAMKNLAYVLLTPIIPLNHFLLVPFLIE